MYKREEVKNAEVRYMGSLRRFERAGDLVAEDGWPVEGRFCRFGRGWVVGEGMVRLKTRSAGPLHPTYSNHQVIITTTTSATSKEL